MAKPTADEIRDILEGYCIDSSRITDTWIENRRDRTVIPIIERITRQSFSGETEVTEYYSGNGQNVLRLRRRYPTELVSIEYVTASDNLRTLSLNNVVLVETEGVLKARRNVTEAWLQPIFPKGDKNLKITYKYGFDDADIPIDICEAIGFLTADVILTFLEGRSGGGDVSVPGYGKTYGNRGKYTNIRNELWRLSHQLLSKYITRV